MPNLVPLLILLAIGAALLNVSFVAAAFYALVAIAVGAWWWVHQVQRSLTYRRVFEPRLFFGETAHVSVEVGHGAPLPVPWLVVRDRLPLRLGYPRPYTQAIAIPARGMTKLSYELRGSRRGLYPIGPAQISFGDVFGLQERFIRHTKTDFLIVYPKILPLGSLKLSSKTALGALKSLEPWNEDPARLIGTQDYRSGDSFRRIHWAASARIGKLQVKKLEPAMTIETVIALNLHEDEYEPNQRDQGTELGIVAAASLAQRLTQLRQGVAMLSNGLDPLADAAYDPSDPESFPQPSDRPISIGLGSGQGHVLKLLDVLARVQLGATIPFADLLQRHTLHLSWGATILVITGDERDGLPEAVLRLKRRGFHVAVLLVAAQRSYHQRSTRLEGLGVRLWRAWKEDDLHAAFG